MTDALAADLLAAQAPALLPLPRHVAAQGWDNVMIRLGADLAMRLPRRAVAAELVLVEQRWLPALAPALPVRVPTPLVRGVAQAGYPYPWSVVPWLPGVPAATLMSGGTRVGTGDDEEPWARDLAAVLAALHRPAPADAPHNPVRAVPLAGRAASIRERIERIGADWAVPILDAGVGAPRHDGVPRWVHGDPHPGNVLLGEAGELAALVDFGDLSAGDPACDLAAAWLHFGPSGRAAFRRRYDDLVPRHREGRWERAAAWALAMACAVVEQAPDDPTNRGWADAALDSLRTDAPG
ncbi:aminoglycoside phosphotransferase (APT) family kinase protein [Serinibacter salmoneus]|uniref:Aminoglycoside phosphotransferase (APT) family kinase protein n=1 Tax=Serinibacter salmoneus TaxID=556530 RepID=A0A2A9CZX6_9MICO|nr:aminoglycoside phosphotransferase (APT) family kinase protein [Serinibacter salmoneus]